MEPSDLLRTRARSAPLFLRQGPSSKAVLAAAMARLTSSLSASATAMITSSVYMHRDDHHVGECLPFPFTCTEALDVIVLVNFGQLSSSHSSGDLSAESLLRYRYEHHFCASVTACQQHNKKQGSELIHEADQGLACLQKLGSLRLFSSAKWFIDCLSFFVSKLCAIPR
jgi:hypothetical protein